MTRFAHYCGSTSRAIGTGLVALLGLALILSLGLTAGTSGGEVVPVWVLLGVAVLVLALGISGWGSTTADLTVLEKRVPAPSASEPSASDAPVVEAPVVEAAPPGEEAPVAEQAAEKVLYVAATGSKIFHRPDCAHAMKIPEEKRETFANKRSASAGGRRACKSCE